MHGTISILLITVFPISLFLYARYMEKACGRAKAMNLAINGRNFGSTIQMASNSQFINALWSGAAIRESDKDPNLQECLQKARFHLIFSTVFIVVAIFSLMAMGIYRAT
jgi:hypothetical protein